MPYHPLDEDEPKPLDLLEVGSRFAHYEELRDIFLAGAEIIKELNFKTPADHTKERQLREASDLIQKRIDVLSRFEQNTVWSATLPRTIREIELDRQTQKRALAEKNPPHPDEQQKEAPSN